MQLQITSFKNLLNCGQKASKLNCTIYIYTTMTRNLVIYELWNLLVGTLFAEGLVNMMTNGCLLRYSQISTTDSHLNSPVSHCEPASNTPGFPWKKYCEWLCIFSSLSISLQRAILYHEIADKSLTYIHGHGRMVIFLQMFIAFRLNIWKMASEVK